MEISASGPGRLPMVHLHWNWDQRHDDVLIANLQTDWGREGGCVANDPLGSQRRLGSLCQ
jgi:hypothetical protein